MAAHNFDGSSVSNVVNDANTLPLINPNEQAVLSNDSNGLINPGTDSVNDRYPDPVPMYPYGFETEADPLFTLNPSQKG
jgi:hypothetical protein